MVDNRRLREGLEEEEASERGLGLDVFALGLAVVAGAVGVGVEETGRSEPKRRLGAGAPEEGATSVRTGISVPNLFFPCLTHSFSSSLFSFFSSFSFSCSTTLPPGKTIGEGSSSSSRDISISMSSSSSSSEATEDEGEGST